MFCFLQVNGGYLIDNCFDYLKLISVTIPSPTTPHNVTVPPPSTTPLTTAAAAVTTAPAGKQHISPSKV